MMSFANINLSFINAQGQEIIVYCPESKEAAATQQPFRDSLTKNLRLNVIKKQKQDQSNLHRYLLR
jgi:hypothetical protein